MFLELVIVADEWEHRDLKIHPEIYPRITQIQPRLLLAASYGWYSVVSKPTGDNPPQDTSL